MDATIIKGVEVTWETNVSVGTRISAYRTSIMSKKLVLSLTVNKRGINDVLIALYSIYTLIVYLLMQLHIILSLAV